MKPLLFLIIYTLILSVNAENFQFIKKLKNNEKQTIVVYGTSLTAKGPWVSSFQDSLQKSFGNKALLINSGGSGKDSNWGLQNLSKKVIKFKPDAVFIEFGMNDAVVRFKNSKEKIHSNLKAMVANIRKEVPNCEIIFMTMNPALGIPEGHRSSRKDLNAYYGIYRKLAAELKLPIIDHYKNWIEFLKDKENYKLYIPDGIHPNKLGCDKVTVPLLLQKLNIKE